MAAASAPVPVIPNAAGDFATAAYARLAAGDRRGAVRLFDAALAAGSDPRGAAWLGARDALTRRWSGSAYSVLRAAGGVDLAVTPVLGGGQSGAALAWSLDPLSPRPLALIVRAAAGIAWRPLPGLTLAAERMFGRDAWTLRAAAGTTVTRGHLDAAAYGEAGVVGDTVYAAAQARAGMRFAVAPGLALGPGIGAWASIEHAARNVGRVDLGPGIAARAGRIDLALDYRFRIAGNAAPGSGVVVTLATGF